MHEFVCTYVHECAFIHMCLGGAQQVTGQRSIEQTKIGQYNRFLHFPSLIPLGNPSTYIVPVAVLGLSIPLSVHSLKFDTDVPKQRRPLSSSEA